MALLGVTALHAQVDMKLAELGMENIRTAHTEKGVAVAFEDRAFRSSYEGVGHAVKAALDGMTEDGELRMAVMDANGLPQLEIYMDRTLVTNYRKGKMSLREAFEQMQLRIRALTNYTDMPSHWHLPLKCRSGKGRN